jgi:hypothetical protein
VPSTPFNGPFSEADIIAPFISAMEVLRLGINLKSMRLTLDVGTRIAVPSSFPKEFGHY